MDRNQIITLLVNAVITIVTTAVVVRLSLNKGKLGVTSKVKAKLTPKFKAYIKLILSLLIFICIILYLYWEIRKPALPTRLDVFGIVFNTIGCFIWFGISTYCIGQLAILKGLEKAQTKSDLPKNS
jgi:hypothetical protein